MSVYRGGKPKNKNPAKPPKPQPQPTPQPQVRQPDSELIGLNDHRQRHGHDPLDDPEAIDDGPEVDDQVADSGPPPGGGFYDRGGGFYNEGPEGGGRRGLGPGATKLAKSAAGKKIALAASGFFAPIIIVVGLMLLAMGAGFQADQVARVITGVRFSRLYGQMSKRLGHIRETHTLWSIDPDNKNTTLQELDKRRVNRKTSLVGRLTGTSDKKIHRDLRSRGYDFEFADKGVPGRERAIGLLDRDGKRVLNFSKDKPQSSISQLRDFEVKVKGQPGHGDGLWGRFKARRTTRLIAYQAGFKFQRFRKAMNDIRRTRNWVSNKIRGPPPADLVSTSQAVSDDIITQKSGVRRRVFGNGLRLGSMVNVSDGDIENAGHQWAKETQKGWGKRARNWVDGKGKRLERTKVAQRLNSSGKLARVAGFARLGSVLVLVATSFCTIYELVDMISNLAKLKISQQMDTAASLFTVTSQMKAGDMDHALSNNLDGRLDGFANTATYQILHDGSNSPTKEHVEDTITYINHHFNIKKSFGAMFTVMQKFISNFITHFKTILNNSPLKSYDWVANGFNFLLSFIPGVSDPIPSVDDLFNFFLNTGCRELLKPINQIIIGTVLFLLEAVITFFTGGLWAAITVGLRALIQTILLAVVVEGVARAANIEEVVLNHLMPEAVAIASGVDSALAETQNINDLLSEDPGAGPENYLKLDYGAWHLSQGQGLAEGGGLIDRDTAVAQDKVYLAQYKQSYTRQGIWDNIASSRNPYSTVARLRAWLPSNPLDSQPAQIRSASSWLAAKPTGLIGSALADEELDEIRGHLLYPDQGRSVDSIQEGGETTDYKIADSETSNDKVVGFTEPEVNGGGGFNFVANSLYVEENLNDLKDNYGQCLAVSLPEFRLYQAGITKTDGGSFWPSQCEGPEARRYLIYYQDCLHLNDLERIDSNSSPMLASDCDDLLPDKLAEDLEEADSELESTSSIPVSQITNQLLSQAIAGQIEADEPILIENSTLESPIFPSSPRNIIGARLWLVT